MTSFKSKSIGDFIGAQLVNKKPVAPIGTSKARGTGAVGLSLYISILLVLITSNQLNILVIEYGSKKGVIYK